MRIMREIPLEYLISGTKRIDLRNIVLTKFKKCKCIRCREIGFSLLKGKEVNTDLKVNKIEYEAAINATMINGIDQVLEFAKNKDLKQAIFTFNTKKNAEISLKNVNLLRYFNIILGRDNVTNLKPHPDHLTHICKLLNVKPDEILVIGDNLRDIEAAINVGAQSIATHTKLAKVETLQMADTIIKENEIPLKLIEEIEKLL